MLVTSAVQPGAARFSIGIESPTKPAAKATPADGEQSRTEMVKDALRLGTPLYRLEQYFDWLDAHEKN